MKLYSFELPTQHYRLKKCTDYLLLLLSNSESHMFNKLEEIALSATPHTPALECRISRALEPKAVDTNVSVLSFKKKK